ncbi:Olfactory receptor 10V1 [Varanus komodoensis]|nr:Olfactory receptor 10V1 [Varanus komodoensis]
MFFFVFLGGTVCVLLAVVAYDRYVAICHPLHYTLTMSKANCMYLVVASMLLGFLLSPQLTILVFCLPFYGSNEINHFFCDIPAILRLACSNTHLQQTVLFIFSVIIWTIPFLLICISFTFIVPDRLGVLLDPELSLEAQVTAVARSVFLQLRLIHQLRPYLEYDCLATVTHALVTSRLDFCNALYVGLPLKTVRILQLVQNRAASLLTGTGRYVHMTPVLRQLHWLPIEVWAQFKVLVMTYKALNGLGPGYLKERSRLPTL